MGIGVLPPIGSWFAGGAIKAMLSAISAAVDGAAAEALRLTGSLLSSTTSPGLLTTWFSATYWRVAALSALLTVPFLFAAAVHSLVRSDIALLGRAAFGYLPLAAIGVTIAAPLTTLLLSATDEMCSIVAGAAGHDDGTALAHAATAVAGLSAATGSPMLGFFVGLFAVAATIGLWIELLIRAAAVDVIVLLLPLFFAAMVWPARRVWAVRSIETLIALILSKFAIVAVLTLGGSAFGGAASGLSSSLIGATLVVLAVLSPWALLRLLPLHEVAAAAAGGLSQAPRGVLHGAGGTMYEAVRGSGKDPAEPDVAAGLGPDDDGAGVVGRAAGFAAGGVAGGRAAGEARSATPPAGSDTRATGSTSPSAPGTGGFDAETAAGLAAVKGTGLPSRPLPGATAVAPEPVDDRPPIDVMFGQVEWEPFVLGEDGDEVMETPRFTAPVPPAAALDGGPSADDRGGEGHPGTEGGRW